MFSERQGRQRGLIKSSIVVRVDENSSNPETLSTTSYPTGAQMEGKTNPPSAADQPQTPSSPASRGSSRRSSRRRSRTHQRDLNENTREKWQSQPWNGDDWMFETNSGYDGNAAMMQTTTSTIDPNVADNVRTRFRRRVIFFWRMFVRLILRSTDYWLGPSPSNRHCRQVFRSVRAISAEQKRQREQNRWIIHPFSRFRLIWDTIIVLALLITLIALPIDIAFYTQPGKHGAEHGSHTVDPHGHHSHQDHQDLELNDDSYGSSDDDDPSVFGHKMARDKYFWFMSNFICEIFFIFDILLDFRTGYVDEETDEVVLDNRKIAIDYLKSWFFIDLISVIPIDELYELYGPGDQKDFMTLRICRLTKVICLLRMFRVIRYLNHLEMYFLMNPVYMRLINLMIVIGLFIHWNGCLQFTISFATWYPNFPNESWIAMDNLDKPGVSVKQKYTRSVFRAASHMLAIGYGETPPYLTGETWVVIVSMLVGATLVTVFVATIAKLVSSVDTSGKKYFELLCELRQYMRFHKIPKHVQKVCVDFFEQKYRHKYFDERAFIRSSLMSPPLREEIALHNCHELIQNVDMFRNANSDFIYEIISRLEFQVYLPGEYVTYAGQRRTALYFIAHGRVEMRSASGTRVGKLDEGHYFGVSEMMYDLPQPNNVITLDMCDIYSLEYKDFVDISSKFPGMWQLLKT